MIALGTHLLRPFTLVESCTHRVQVPPAAIHSLDRHGPCMAGAVVECAAREHQGHPDCFKRQAHSGFDERKTHMNDQTRIFVDQLRRELKEDKQIIADCEKALEWDSYQKNIREQWKRWKGKHEAYAAETQRLIESLEQ
jgi:hypothetical protein